MDFNLAVVIIIDRQTAKFNSPPNNIFRLYCINADDTKGEMEK